MPRDALADAYRRARYRVRLGPRTVELRVGRRSPDLDAELAARGVGHWAWLTAVNPRSVRLAAAENRRRLAALDAELAALGWPVLAGEAVDPAGRWPAEPSRLLLAPELDRVVALATRWEQHAYLVGRRGRAVELRWTGERRR